MPEIGIHRGTPEPSRATTGRIASSGVTRVVAHVGTAAAAKENAGPKTRASTKGSGERITGGGAST